MDPKLRVLAKEVWSIGRKALPKAQESIRVSVPTFSVNGNYFAMIRDYSNHVNLYFFSGAKLSSKLLEGTGKGMRHIKIASRDDIKSAEIARLLRAAAKLSE